MAELQINTTQNVKINFTSSGVGERLMAFIVDTLVKIIYLVVVSYFGAFDNMDQWSQIAINTILSFPVMFYTLALESTMDGQTIGKRLLKIRVVKFDGYQASISDYLIRWFFRIVDIYFFGIGLFIIAFSKKNQRLGDLAAGTAVIQLRDKVDMSHTILEELKVDYQTSYPALIKLSDNDARIIKETYTLAKQNQDYKTLIKLRDKIIEVTEINNVKHSRDIDFISIILKDYNYYTQHM